MIAVINGYMGGGGSGGLAGPSHCSADITDVATRWYRAPEIMLSFANYVSVCF